MSRKLLVIVAIALVVAAVWASAAYDVEVRRPDGKIVEVELDSSYGVIGSDTDDDGPNDNDGANDD